MSTFFRDLAVAIGDTTSTDREPGDFPPYTLTETSAVVLGMVRAMKRIGKLLFIGNGGSSAIASHMSADWQKNGGYRTMCFTDSAMLTCLANDDGYENVFAHPILLHATPRDILFAISSSGQSPNILKAVEAARKKGSYVVTLSGFKPDNPLRKVGDTNMYVPSSDYGIVECAHLALIHSILNEAICEQG